MKTLRVILITGTALLMSGMMKAQTVAPSGNNTAPTSMSNVVNQRGSLHEVSPAGNAMNGKNAQALNVGAKESLHGRHHKHHRHHRHHKNNNNKAAHQGLRHHKI